MAGGRLQREIGKRRPFESLHEEAALNLARTSDRLQIHGTRLLREHGLTPSQYNVLRILRGEGKPLPILEIAGRMIAVVPGITGLIDRLEALGLVARERCPGDRRVIHVGITPAGVELTGAIDGPIRALNEELFGHLTGEELRELIRLLEKLRAPLADKP